MDTQEGFRERPAGSDGGDPILGTILGGCRIQSLIGRGGMGAVYIGVDEELDRTVAVKTINPEFCRDAGMMDRFRSEARTISRFESPHVVKIYTVGFERGLHYLILEYVAGGNLRNYVERQPNRRLPVSDAVRMMREACDGLAEAERLSIVHRDIKPANLLLDKSGRLKIADFGIAKRLHTRTERTVPGSFIGTPLYASPEQCVAQPLDHRSDMYSLGTTFTELLVGAPPFVGTEREIVDSKSKRARVSPRDHSGSDAIPDGLCRILERMTAQKMADRYPTFHAIANDLEGIGSRPLWSPTPKSGSGGDAALRSRSASPLPEVPQVPLSDRYELVSELGAGGMGRVFKARVRKSGEFVAVKRLLSHSADDERAKEFFVREALSLRQLRHAHIVQCLDYAVDAEGLWIAMELVGEGHSLRDLVTRSGELGEDDLLHLATQIGGALAFAHNLGILHRDVKPQNILLAAENDYRLADFGLAREGLFAGESTTGTVVGSTEYVAPEQVDMPKKVDQRADIFSFAKTLYFALTKEVPLTVDLDRIPPRFRVQMKRALERKREHRYFSMNDFVEALGGKATMTDVRAVPAESIPRIKTQARAAELRGDWRAAMQHYTTILHRTPDDETVQHALAHLIARQKAEQELWQRVERMEREGARGDAIQLCREISAANPNHPAVGKLQQLLRFEAEDAERLRKQQIEAKENGAEAAFRDGHLAKAKSLARDLTAIDKPRGAKLLERYERAERRRKARSILDRAETAFAKDEFTAFLDLLEQARAASGDGVTAREIDGLLHDLDAYLDDVHATAGRLLRSNRPKQALALIAVLPGAVLARHEGLQELRPRVEKALALQRSRRRFVAKALVLTAVVACAVGWFAWTAHEAAELERAIGRVASLVLEPGAAPAPVPAIRHEIDQIDRIARTRGRWMAGRGDLVRRALQIVEAKEQLCAWAGLPRWVMDPSNADFDRANGEEVRADVEQLAALSDLDWNALFGTVAATERTAATPTAALARFHQRHQAWSVKSIREVLAAGSAATTTAERIGSFWRLWSRVKPPNEARSSAALADQAAALESLLEDPRAGRDAAASESIGRLADVLGSPRDQQRRTSATSAEAKKELDAADAALDAVHRWLDDEAQITAISNGLDAPDFEQLTPAECAGRLDTAARKLTSFHPASSHARLDESRLVWATLHLDLIERSLARAGAVPPAPLTPPKPIGAEAVAALTQFLRLSASYLDHWAELDLVDHDGAPLSSRFRRDVTGLAEGFVDPSRAIALADALRGEEGPLPELLAFADRLMDRPDLVEAAREIKQWNENESKWRLWAASLRNVTSLAPLALVESIPSIRDEKAFLGTHREPSWRKIADAWFDRHVSDVDALVVEECAAPLEVDAEEKSRARLKRIDEFDPTWAGSVCAARASKVRAGWDARFRASALEVSKRDVAAIEQDAELERLDHRFHELLGFVSDLQVRGDTEAEASRFLELLQFRRDWLKEVEPLSFVELLSEHPNGDVESFNAQLSKCDSLLRTAREKWQDELGERTSALLRRLTSAIVDKADNLLRGYGTAPDRYARVGKLEQLEAHERAIERCLSAIEVVEGAEPDAASKPKGDRDALEGERGKLEESLAYLSCEKEFRQLQKRIDATSAAASIDQALKFEDDFRGLLDPKWSVGSNPPPAILGEERLAQMRDAIVDRLRGIAEQRALTFTAAGSVVDSVRIQESICRLRVMPGIAAAPAAPSPLDAMRSTPELRYLGRNPQGGQEFQNDRTGIVFVLVAAGPSGGAARPCDAFLIAKDEITNEILLKDLSFLQKDQSSVPDAARIKSEDEDLPACVTWQSAVAFCDRFGFSLPTEAQWTRACGPGVPPLDSRKLNVLLNDLVFADEPPQRRSVRDRPSLNELGVRDMIGNVREWLFEKTPAGGPREVVDHVAINSSFAEYRGATPQPELKAPILVRQLVQDQPLEPPTIGFRPVVNLPLRREP